MTAASPPPNTDPLLYLPDTCMLHVLEFVGTQQYDDDPPPKKEDNFNHNSSVGWPSILATARFYYHVAQISKSWKELADRLIQQPPFMVELNFDPVPQTKRTAAILWLARHRLCIGSFVQSKWAHNFPLPLFHWLLQHCQTNYLTEAHFSCSIKAWLYRFPEEAKAEIQTGHAPQEILGMHCPNLTSIVWEVSVDELQLVQDWPILSYLSSATTMELYIRSDRVGEVLPKEFQTRFLPALLQHCTSLQCLVLQWIGNTLSYIMGDRQDSSSSSVIVVLQSTSLKELSIENFQPWQHTVFSLDCPQLQSCVCASHGLADGRQQTVRGVDDKESICIAPTSGVLRRVTPLKPIQYGPTGGWMQFHLIVFRYDWRIQDLHELLGHALLRGVCVDEEARVAAQRLRPKRRGNKAGVKGRQPRQRRPLPRRREWRR
jgi:hypothetical protein